MRFFSRELSQPLTRRLMHGTALMNSRCAGHPKHTLAPWHSSRGTCSCTALRNSLRPGPFLTTGNLSPNPDQSTHLSQSHWGMVGTPSEGQDLLFFGSKDGGDTDQLTDQTPIPIYSYLLLIPQPGTLSLASLALL